MSGPYAAVWAGFTLGTLNDDGYRLMGTFQGEEVKASDAFGMTLVEAIWRGLNWRLRCVGLEFSKPGILAMIQAFGSTGDPSTTFTPFLDNIGDRYSKFAETLVMGAVLADPPTMPQTLVADGAIMAPQSNVQYLMTSKVREAPFEMVLLPYQDIVGSLTVQLSFTTT